METIGQRITRLRNSKGWSRPQLGKEMAKAIDREKAFSGEVIRLYEEGINAPGADARAALAKVFERPESYIQFGVDAGAKHQDAELTNDERALIVRYRNADPRWQLSLRLLAALATEDQIEAATDVNVVVARILGKKPAEIRYASNERVAAAFGPAPVIPRQELAHVMERTASYNSGLRDRASKRSPKKR